MADVEDIILAARNLAMACIGGQVQFRFPGGTCEEHMKSILNVAGSRAMTWMIGFKLNENSNLRWALRTRSNNA